MNNSRTTALQIGNIWLVRNTSISADGKLAMVRLKIINYIQGFLDNPAGLVPSKMTGLSRHADCWNLTSSWFTLIGRTSAEYIMVDIYLLFEQ